MYFRARRKKEESVGFQYAPMVDIMTLALCFFLTSQWFMRWESEIDISLPTAETAKTSPRVLPGEIILNILQTGDVIVNGRKLDEAALKALLKRLVGLFAGQPVIVRADKKTSYEDVIHVLDICRQCDVGNISFATATSKTTLAR